MQDFILKPNQTIVWYRFVAGTKDIFHILSFKFEPNFLVQIDLQEGSSNSSLKNTL